MTASEYRVIETTIPTDLDAALADLVALSGVSKASLIRDALTEYLRSRGALAPTHKAPAPTATRGRLRSPRKDQP